MADRKIYYISIFIGWLFVTNFTVKTWAQDSISIDPQENAVTAERDTLLPPISLTRWETLIDTLINDVDSIKQSLLKDPKGPIHDSVARAQAVIALDHHQKRAAATKREVNTYWRQAKSTLDKSLAQDSLSDSQRQPVLMVKATEDSLVRLNGRLDSLIGDVAKFVELLQQEGGVEAFPTDTTGTAIDASTTTPRGVLNTVRRNLASNELSSDYFLTVWSNGLLLLLLSLYYFYFLFRLSRKTNNDNLDEKLYKNDPLWIAILKAFVFFLVLFPLTSSVIPPIVLQICCLLIFVSFYILSYSEYSTTTKRTVRAVLAIYIILIIANLLLSQAIWSRMFMALSSLAGIAIVWGMRNAIKKQENDILIQPFIRWSIMVIFALAFVCAIVNYLYLTRICSVTAAILLVQSMSLKAFRKMILHDLELHYVKSPETSFIRRFDLQKMHKSVGALITVISVAVIFVVIINSLQITAQVDKLVDSILLKPRKIGDITFNYANLFLAIAVLWGSNWFQKNLKNILNTPSQDEVQVKRMALFPVFRLLIVILAFFFAISILGLGLDKLTVIIGALSVGIGLGLQNVINNFVSGIILVFEKPFKIGDYIELADKKGQVMEIGIRSSVLMTDQGARVIIPNGDLLSGRLVNWTFSASDIRVNMEFSITGSAVIEEVKKIFKERLKGDRYVDTNIPIKVYTKDIQDEAYRISIQVGIKNVRQIERFKSSFLEDIKKEMKGQGLGASSL